MKKILALLLAASLLLGVGAHGTSGLFTDTETATATITAWVEEGCEEYECTPIVSDTNTMVTEVNGTAVDPEENAELAWVHGTWWSSLDYKFGYPDNDAQWIWETKDSVDPVDGRVVRFEREFCIPCDPESATLHITADNGYEVWINGNFVGSDQVFDYGGVDWEDSDLTEDWVKSSGWQSVESYPINPAWLSTGRNVLEILAGNEQMEGGTSTSNPAGVIYQLDIEYGDDCEYCPTQGEDDCEEGTCEKFNVSDFSGNSRKIFKYDAFGNPGGSFDLHTDNGSPSGVYSSTDSLYVLDQPDSQVYHYDCCGVLIERSRRLDYDGKSIGNPEGLAIDIAAGEMWVVADTNKSIYKYSLSAAFPDTGTPLNAIGVISLNTNVKKIRGLAIDSSYLYVLDYSTSAKETRFYRYLKADGSVTVSKVLMEHDGVNALSSPAGAMFDGTSLWVVDSGTDMVYQYDLDDLFDGGGPTLDATWEFSLDSTNDKATGI